jgi:hypothetical protein
VFLFLFRFEESEWKKGSSLYMAHVAHVGRELSANICQLREGKERGSGWITRFREATTSQNKETLQHVGTQLKSHVP